MLPLCSRLILPPPPVHLLLTFIHAVLPLPACLTGLAFSLITLHALPVLPHHCICLLLAACCYSSSLLSRLSLTTTCFLHSCHTLSLFLHASPATAPLPFLSTYLFTSFLSVSCASSIHPPSSFDGEMEDGWRTGFWGRFGTGWGLGAGTGGTGKGGSNTFLHMMGQGGWKGEKAVGRA